MKNIIRLIILAAYGIGFFVLFAIFGGDVLSKTASITIILSHTLVPPYYFLNIFDEERRIFLFYILTSAI